MQKPCTTCGKNTGFMDKTSRLPFCNKACRSTHRCPHNHYNPDTDAYYVDNIELRTIHNQQKGPVIVYRDPSGYTEVGVMCIQPGDRADWEKHETATQFIRVEAGYGQIYIGKSDPRPLGPGESAIVPANTTHMIEAKTKLQFYTLYNKRPADPWVH